MLCCKTVIEDATRDSVIWTVTHFRNCGPKLHTSRDFCKYYHSMESKAFSKSRKMARPGMFFALVKDIIFDIILILSPINLPLTYPN